MNERSIRRLFTVCLLTCMGLFQLAGQDYKALTGKWSMTSETDNDPVKWTLVLKGDGGTLSASLATDGGEQSAKDFTYADGVLKFKAPYQGEDYDIVLKLTGEKLEGTWSGGGNSGKTSGTKM